MTVDICMKAQLPPNPSAIGMLTDSQLADLRGRFSALSNHSVENCITCGGRRTFRWYAGVASQDVVEYDCPCEDQYLLYRWLLHCGVMPKYQRLGWRDIIDVSDTSVMKEAIGQALGYVDQSEAYVGRGISLVFTGPVGTGKTLLAHLVLKDLIAKGVDCYATTFAAMIDSFAEGWREKRAAHWFDSRVRNAGVLLVDDLGREYKQKTVDGESGKRVLRAGVNSVGENMLESVIRYRTAAQQPTIITTNIPEDKIREGYGGNTMSLLTESVIFCLVPGSDRRREVEERARWEIEQGIIQRPVVMS